MKLLNLFAAKSQVDNSRSGDCRRLKQAGNKALHTISGGHFFRRILQMHHNFLTPCTIKRTQGKKLQADGVLSGRSMVEMLGVLAIIGVLSVGAIAGYNTAMYKHRMNKTIQAFTDLLQNLAELSTKNWGEEEIFGSSDMVKYGLLPASMCPEDYVNVWGQKGYACKLPLGEIVMDFFQDSYLYGNIYVSFYEGDIVKSCVDFLSHGWQNMYPQEWLRTDNEFTGSYILVYGQDSEFLWSLQQIHADSVKKDNITLSDIQNACDVCKGAEYCEIIMLINHEI